MYLTTSRGNTFPHAFPSFPMKTTCLFFFEICRGTGVVGFDVGRAGVEIFPIWKGGFVCVCVHPDINVHISTRPRRLSGEEATSEQKLQASGKSLASPLSGVFFLAFSFLVIWGCRFVASGPG